MKVTYNAKTKVFKLVYRDPLKVAKGEKHPYSRKQQTWKSPFPPNRNQCEKIKRDLINFALDEIKKAEQEVERMADVQQVKKEIAKTDFGKELLPIGAFRPLVKKAIIDAFESVNWVNFVNWNELYKHIEQFILERVENPNDEDEAEI